MAIQKFDIKKTSYPVKGEFLQRHRGTLGE